ncbi:MAG: hypothetical protein Unbinned5081contig1002_14 [Prokaryotic dsDNA virus sp.]|nr:MAG: hypothetical protein Unbinned5081contig1002_14 [Prokaryotic dsDNA virus sp.]|tara:strand:+ start:3663 stop:3848 length:186 start_codon:yes stop_codon:yes gene_type:complete
MSKEEVPVHKIDIEFSLGADFKECVQYMYDLHHETNAEISAVFNGVHIRMMDDSFRRLIDK